MHKKGPLSGIPGIVKDVIAQQGRKLTCASKILKILFPLSMRLRCRALSLLAP